MFLRYYLFRTRFCHGFIFKRCFKWWRRKKYL